MRESASSSKQWQVYTDTAGKSMCEVFLFSFFWSEYLLPFFFFFFTNPCAYAKKTKTVVTVCTGFAEYMLKITKIQSTNYSSDVR